MSRAGNNLPLTVPCHRAFEVGVAIPYQRLGRGLHSAVSTSPLKSRRAPLVPSEEGTVRSWHLRPPQKVSGGEPSHHDKVAHDERVISQTCTILLQK
jgi:hypothetical protein